MGYLLAGLLGVAVGVTGYAFVTARLLQPRPRRALPRRFNR